MMQDIPKIYTAMAEWLACVSLIFVYRKFVDKQDILRIGLKLTVSLLVLCGIQIWCGTVSDILWLVGMTAAIAVMVITVESCLKIGIKESIYLNARNFLKAEFFAAVEWQIYFYYFNLQEYKNNIASILFCLIFYLIGYTVLGWIEEVALHEQSRKCMIPVTRKQMCFVWGITLLIFALSNMSYISISNPFTGTETREIFNIRTLFDLVGLLMMEAFHLQKLDSDEREEMNAINAVLQKQYIQFRASQENIELINRKYHDLKHQLQVLRTEPDNRKRSAYLDEIEEGIKKYEIQNKTGNSVLDTILAGKGENCLNKNISLITVIDGSLLNHIYVMDLCTIFGNALDNAIEYEMQVQEPEKRLIHVSVSEKNNFICIVIENYYEGELVLTGQLPKTTKSNKAYHGYGLKSIQHTVKKYGGYMNVCERNEWFRLEIILPKGK